MNRYGRAVVMILVLFVLGCTVWAQNENAGKPAPEAQAASRSERPAPNWYKIEVALHEFDSGKMTNTRNYVFTAEEKDWSRLRLGDRVPVPTGPRAVGSSNGITTTNFQYIDVGLNIDCRVTTYQANQLALTLMVDQSGMVENKQNDLSQPVIRGMKTNTTTFVQLNKPTLVSSIEDPSAATRKYTIEATVTKLNP